MGAAIGSLKCRGVECSRDVPVTETAGGSLSMRCGFCGFSAYAQPGTKAARNIRAAMTPDAEPAPAKPAAPATDDTRPPGAPPVKKIPTSAFDLGALS